eukprot:419141-Rhodomonas_salina.1
MQDLRVLAAALFEGVQYNKTFCALQLMVRNRDCQISPEQGGLVLTLPSSPPTPRAGERGRGWSAARPQTAVMPDQGGSARGGYHRSASATEEGGARPRTPLEEQIPLKEHRRSPH